MTAMRRAIIALALIALWEAAYQFGALNPIIFGAPSLIIKAAITDGTSFLTAFRITLFEIAVATAIAWIIGISLGVMLGASHLASRIAAPILSSLIALPLVILYPLLMAWTGMGPQSKIIFGVLSGIFPIALNALVGVRDLDPGFRRMAEAMGASQSQVLWLVLAPLALPAIISGLRLGTALIIIGVVLSEMLGSIDGIGFWISYHRSLFNTGQVYLGILLALAMAAIANAALTLIEKKYARAARA